MPTRVDLGTANLLTLLGAYPTLQPTAGTMTLTLLAADTTNKEKFQVTGKEILVAYNSNAGSTARTVTITSVADEKGRTGDITTYSIAARKLFAFGPAQLAGWQQSDGYVYVEASDAEVLWGVLRLP